MISLKGRIDQRLDNDHACKYRSTNLCVTVFPDHILLVASAISLSLQHRPLWHLLHSLPNTQIRKNLLRSAQDRIKFVRAMELLNQLAHTTLRDSPATKDVHSIVGDVMRTSRSVALEKSNRSTEELRLLVVCHIVHLVSYDLKL